MDLGKGVTILVKHRWYVGVEHETKSTYIHVLSRCHDRFGAMRHPTCSLQKKGAVGGVEEKAEHSRAVSHVSHLGEVEVEVAVEPVQDFLAA